MKKIIAFMIAFMIVSALFTACGEKKNTADETLSAEQETVLVDSIGQGIDNSTDELNQHADSLTNQVDSLLRDI
jgi:hypothetical protein